VLFSSLPGGEPILASDPLQAAPLYFQRSQRRPLYYGASIPTHVDGQGVWIQVAQDLEHPDAIVDDIVTDFLSRVAWFTAPIMLALAAMDVIVVRRAFRPVLNASERARTINPARIDLRLPREGLPVEIVPLVDAINNALDRLEAGFRVQREFTADAAHELRTPLSVLGMRIEILTDKAAAAELRTDIEIMSRIVEQLLALSELEHFPVDMTATVNIQEVCGDVAASIAPLALSQGKDIALVGAPGPVMVRGDRHSLFRAVRNLVENAVEHTAPRTTVEIMVQPDGTVRVLDKGPGVKDEIRPLLFRRFWRGDHRRAKGAGLGLSIVARIAEAHAGTVTVENRMMGGAAFVLTLMPAEPNAF
jgi:signal transduction histidine kinase